MSELTSGPRQSRRDIPPIYGFEDRLGGLHISTQQRALDSVSGPARSAEIESACLVALHMHQPLFPAADGSGRLISNLEAMLHSESSSDKYNAEVYLQCYERMGEIVPRLLSEGNEPRIMLEYSGTLLHGLSLIGKSSVLDRLQILTRPQCRRAAEFLGCPWGHAVAPSTPPADFRLHVHAWQQHFAALFGWEALELVQGFSPSEMALPNHPDVAYQFVKTLRDAGYRWVLVQEHTVEVPESGQSPVGVQRYIPNLLVCRNSHGEEATIVALIKTQGSDTKLIGQMQPYYEAKQLHPVQVGGCMVAPAATQISDGENGGVMMNEFPSKYEQVIREAKDAKAVMMTGSEYLNYVFSRGLKASALPRIQPSLQHRIWERFRPGEGAEQLAQVISSLERERPNFHFEGASWTNDMSWVRGYSNVLQPMQQASVRFHQAVDSGRLTPSSPGYGPALYHLLCSQTSCFRYWGQGPWTERGIEICRCVDKFLPLEDDRST